MIRIPYFWDEIASVLETAEQTDALLLSRLRLGEHTAFDQFYDRYWKPLYRLAFKILKDEPASEDIVQETFIRFWENREKLENINIKGWLSTTSYRLVLKALQQRQCQEKIEAVNSNEPLAEPADQSLYLRQLQFDIAACVDTLPRQCRKVYTLSREHHLPVKNIAEELGISPKTVEAHITAALKTIRRALGSALILFSFFL